MKVYFPPFCKSEYQYSDTLDNNNIYWLLMMYQEFLEALSPLIYLVTHGVDSNCIPNVQRC